MHVDEPTVLHASSWQQFAKQANMNAYLMCNVNIFNENLQLLIIATLASITTQRKKRCCVNALELHPKEFWRQSLRLKRYLETGSWTRENFLKLSARVDSTAPTADDLAIHINRFAFACMPAACKMSLCAVRRMGLANWIRLLFEAPRFDDWLCD